MKRLPIVVILATFLTGCSSYSAFFIDNRTGWDLEVDVTSVYDGIPQTGIQAKDGLTTLLGEMQFIESSGPLPSVVFETITVRVPAESNRVIYSKDPVIDLDWERVVTAEKAFGTTENEFVLILSNS